MGGIVRITFWLTSTTRELNENNWGKTPLGGAEVSAINLGEELLNNGHEITYFLQRCIPFDKGNLRVRRHQDITGDEKEPDYFICVRPHKILELPFKCKKILWSGDAFDQTSNEIFFNASTAQSMDALVFKSKWQKRKILEKFGFIDPDKAHVIYNGFKSAYFKGLAEKPQKNRFIHASRWYRGVHNFIDIWPKIKKAIPEAVIYIYSAPGLYHDWTRGTNWPELAEKLNAMDGVYLVNPIPQWRLVKELRKSWAMLYPNSGFVESSCGLAIQSAVAGTPVIATKRAGLKETIGDAGVLIEPTKDWKDKFVEGVIKCQDQGYRNQLSRSGRRKWQNSTWERKAVEWVDFLKSL